MEVSEVLRVNADAINLVLVEEGVPDSAYLAVKIANTLDPPNNPNWDAEKVARLYLALGTTTGGLTREAERNVAMLRAAVAIGMERAARLCEERASLLADMALKGLPEQARLRESMEAAVTRCAHTIRACAADDAGSATALDESGSAQ